MSTQIQRWLEGKIDFEGQKLADQITRYSLITITIISFLAGVVVQSLRLSFGILSFGTFTILIIVLPSWPLFNQHPVKWLPVRKEPKKER